MKHLINILVFIFLWGMGWFVGVETTYQEGFQLTDLISMLLFLSGLFWIIKKYA